MRDDAEDRQPLGPFLAELIRRHGTNTEMKNAVNRLGAAIQEPLSVEHAKEVKDWRGERQSGKWEASQEATSEPRRQTWLIVQS